jgi:hypothetical protein
MGISQTKPQSPFPTEADIAKGFQNCQIPRDKQKEYTKHLKTYGFAVVKGVLSPEDVDTAKDKHWEYLESLGSGIKRNDL